MIKYFIVLIKWDILNNSRIERKLHTLKNGYNEKSPSYIGINIYRLYKYRLYTFILLFKTWCRHDFFLKFKIKITLLNTYDKITLLKL